MKMTLSSLHNFFEHPQSRMAKLVHAFLLFCILFSVVSAFVGWGAPEFALQYSFFLDISEKVILVVFTLEYFLRFVSAPEKWKFFRHPFNLIDLAVILPFYFGINAGAGRILRVFRILKLIKHLHVLDVFRFRGTILEKIFPLLIILSLSKIVIWILEERGLWIARTGLEELFAIIGFALGIILAEKVSTTTGKYFAIKESFFRISGILHSLAEFFPKEKKFLAAWGESFLSNFHNEGKGVKDFFPENVKIIAMVKKYENPPADLSMLAKDLLVEANFVLQKKSDLVPSAYNILLQQAILLYFGLMVVFLPGATGFVSVIVATYILYGLYHVTLDFDTVSGGEYNLINVDTDDLEKLLFFLKNE